VGYLLLRSYTSNSESGARSAAVLGIVGFVDVSINYMAVTWWRTLHPPHQVSSSPPQVVAAILITVVTFTFLYGFLLVQVYRLQAMQNEALELRARVEMEEEE
jgi:heme exporter protein C